MQRREFIKAGAAAVAMPAILKAAAADQKIRMGFIGVGNRGTQLMHLFMNFPDVEVTALCDVYEPYLHRRERDFDPKFLEWGLKGRLPSFTAKDGSLKRHEAALAARVAAGQCRLYADYRRLLEDRNVDAVCIATPDHWHAIMTIDAICAGKDVYCEKPISLSIEEGEAVMRAAELYQRIYQGGVQRRNVGNFVTAMRLATSGRLGRVHTVHAGMARMGVSAVNHYLPEEPLPDKKDLDWDLWTGPAPLRAYNSAYVFKHKWHDEYDYHGDLSEWGSHTIDLCQLALGRAFTAPVKYVPVSPKEVHAFYPDGVKMVLRSGGFRDSCAIRLEGDEGWVETDDSGSVYVSDPLLLEGHTIRHESWARPVQHPAEFIACVRSRLRASAPADSLHMTHVACHAASVAYHLNRTLAFDLASRTFPQDADATKLLKRSNRAPWTL